ncbi:MAG: DUF1294 domain-containing protein [Ruminococcus sp.]|nr:DUF1294 domain-containing protein [Ruminococcus sp.]
MLYIYLAITILMSIVAFSAFGIDKQKAKKDAWRIPEATLLCLSLCGGSVGAMLGMAVFHHKTKKLKFKIFVPITFLLWLIIGILIMRGT